MVSQNRYSAGLRPESKVCSEHMIERKNLSLEDQERYEIFPESKS